MEYIKRDLERKFTEMNNFFKAVLVTGARQVGKTTMLRHLAEGSNRTYVTLDDIAVRELAAADPVLFFQTYKPPIIIDEIQHAPQLFGHIKYLCDKSDETGQFWLTGSQHFGMMKHVRETLAGRIGILELHSLSQREKSGILISTPLDFSFENLQERNKLLPSMDILQVYEHIWRGGMPQIQNVSEELRQEYFNSYVDTYLMRDVAELGAVSDITKFLKFLKACAALTAEQVNYKNLAQAAEISEPTAKEWLRLLEALCIVFLLPPFSNNGLKRLTKTPKLYFYDTGLCSFLSMWLTRDTLMNGAASGHYFENYVVIELLKHFSYSKNRANMFYYRDSNAKEIDLLIESNGYIHPIEIKRASSPERREIKKYSLLDKASIPHGFGGIICMCEKPLPIDEKNSFIPSYLI